MALPKGWMTLGDGWSITPELTPDPNWDAALKCAKGRYQYNLILGYESLSGSTLRGRAKHWGAKYARSRDALLRKLTAAGVVWSRQLIGNRIVLCIGDWGTNPTYLTPEPSVQGMSFTTLGDLFAAVGA